MSRAVLLLLLALALAVGAIAMACDSTSGDDTLVPSSLALSSLSLESGGTFVWGWQADDEGGTDASPGPDASVSVALGASNLQLAVNVLGPPGTWQLGVAADGALSAAPTATTTPVLRTIQIADTDSGVATAQVLVPLYLVEASGPAGIHIVFGQTAQDFIIGDVVAQSPSIEFCQSIGADGGCVPLPVSGDAGDAGGGEGGAMPGPCSSAVQFSVPVGPYPAEGDFVYAQLQTNAQGTPPWAAAVTAQGSLALAGNASSVSIDDPGTTWVELVARSPGLGTVTATLAPSETVQDSLMIGPPRLAIQSMAPADDGTDTLVTVCTGASTGNLSATTSSGMLAATTVPIAASTECGAGYGGAAILEWSAGKGIAVFTLGYQGGSGTVTQLICAPAGPAPPPVDAGLTLSALSVAATNYQWPPAMVTEAGLQPSFLLVDVTLMGETADAGPPGFSLANETVAFTTSSGMPASGTFTTDATGRGFFNVTVPAGVTSVDVQFAAGGASTTRTFTEMP